MAQDTILAKATVKGVRPQELTEELLQAQAEVGIQNRVEVAEGTPDTCSDERPREDEEARYSIYGGSGVYGLLIREATGYFSGSSLDMTARLAATVSALEDEGIVVGGHKACKANEAVAAIIHAVGSNPRLYAATAERRLGDQFDPTAVDEIGNYMAATDAAGVYKDWDESVLPGVLGDEKAARAIETLKPVEHKAVTRLRNQKPGTTIAQNPLYDQSVAGEGSYVFDDRYADRIEGIVTTGIKADRMAVLARHAREMIISVIDTAVPNPFIQEIDV